MAVYSLGHYVGQSGAGEDHVVCVSNESSSWKKYRPGCVTDGLSAV